MHPYRLSVFVLALAPLLFAQTPPPAPVTQVLTTLTVKNGISRDQIMKVMNDEVKATVRLYLDGRIQQWYARSDGKGVVFIMNCTSVADAKALTETLPLSKAGFADFEYTALSPLTPLRLLLTDNTTKN